MFTDESRFVTDVKGSGEAVENVMLPVTSVQYDQFGFGSVTVWGGISMKGCKDLYRLDSGRPQELSDCH